VNRILFLPLNRNLLYFVIRAMMKGHSVYWKRWGIEAQKGEKSDLQTNDFFDEVGLRENIRTNCIHYRKWRRYWSGYFRKKGINHLVTDIDGHTAVLAALDEAQAQGITTSYIAHGPGEIYYCSKRLKWYAAEVFDYYYAQTAYSENYIRSYCGRTFAKKFSRGKVKYKFDKKARKGRKTILYAPAFILVFHGDQYHGMSTNEERVKWNLAILNILQKSDCNVLWCHNPNRDWFKNPLTDRLISASQSPGFKWVKKDACTQFKKADLVLTDIGASVFFEAIHAGKPTLCLHWMGEKEGPQLRPSTKTFLMNSVRKYSTYRQLYIELKRLIETPYLYHYIPRKYLETELNRPNDSLVWEER